MTDRSTGDTAAELLDRYLDDWLDNQLRALAGHEREALIELIRSADLHAYFLHYFRTPELTDEFAARCRLIIAGVGPLLSRVLPKLELYGDGIPWIPSTLPRQSWADELLETCGRLARLRRLAHCERYGLLRCEIHSTQHISIHITADDKDELDRVDREWNVAASVNDRQGFYDDITRQMVGWARDRIDQYVQIDKGHFIQYDSDWDLLALYQQAAEALLPRSAEADALPDDAILGPYTFGDWKKISVVGAARAMLHLSFATRLSALNKSTVDLRNLLTIFVRQDDLRAVWQQQIPNADKKTIDEISDVFMLNAVHADEYFTNHDEPLPYNIQFGKYFALLPQFGYLCNPCTFLISQLKRKYPKDWDSAVNQREAKFQQSLYSLLYPSGYVSGRENVIIRNPTGAIDTDIDAVLYEPESNSIYLIQLKWFDVVAFSLKERQSRITNLLKANKWIERVNTWAHSFTNPEFVSCLGLKNIPSAHPLQIRLVVLTRTVARYGGKHDFDRRAAWISWPQLCRIVAENKTCKSPLEIAWKQSVDEVAAEYAPQGASEEYEFPRLKIDVFS